MIITCYIDDWLFILLFASCNFTGQKRENTDDDAEDGEEGAHQVAPDFAQGEQEREQACEHEEELGKVQVESAISGAKISLSSINGNYIEMKDVPFEFEVPEGEYLVVVYAPGFANYQLQIKVNAGESRRVKADLTNVGEDISEGAPIWQANSGR